MLCQLVCTDRRYARMNCFNIRELQGILKRKFFVDLVNSHDHRGILEESMIGMRYKANQSMNTDLDYSVFYNFGLHTTQRKDTNAFSFGEFKTSPNNRVFIDSISCNILNFINSGASDYGSSKGLLSNAVLKVYVTLVDFFSLMLLLNPLNSFLNSINLNAPILAFFNNFYFLNFNSLSFYTNYKLTTAAKNDIADHAFSKNLFIRDDNTKAFFSESSQNQRLTRFSNPLINYDYKTGNYIGNWESQYPHLINSFIEVARGIRKPV
jgi:hypothetical protein